MKTYIKNAYILDLCDNRVKIHIPQEIMNMREYAYGRQEYR